MAAGQGNQGARAVSQEAIRGGAPLSGDSTSSSEAGTWTLSVLVVVVVSLCLVVVVIIVIVVSLISSSTISSSRSRRCCSHLLVAFAHSQYIRHLQLDHPIFQTLKFLPSILTSSQ